MGFYAIGIGGTGAKCVEALVHLAAAGMIPQGDLHVMFVDPDKANGSLDRAQATVNHYRVCRDGLYLGSTPVLNTRITLAQPHVWSPFIDDTKPTLETFFRYNALKERTPELGHLFDVLYSRAERQASLDIGFHGHPSIGAAVLAATVQLGQDEPWATFRNLIAQDIKGGVGAKIFLFASIFGGTGAAGFPTIARLIHEEIDALGKGKAQLGGALMLPYFSFLPEVDHNELRASSENFLMSTQAALRYYRQQAYLQVFDSIYLLGNETLSPVKTFSIGAKAQKNEPHFLEVFAGLAAVDFFKAVNPPGPLAMVARRQSGNLVWGDLPTGREDNPASNMLGHLTRFAFAFQGLFMPMLEDIRAKGAGYRAPWYIEFFSRQGIDIEEAGVWAKLQHIRDYCDDVLSWLESIHTSAPGERVELINITAFPAAPQKRAYVTREFGNLVLPEAQERKNAMARVWEKISNLKARDSAAEGVGRFVHALYQASV